jgi:cold shock protein
VPTGKVKWYDAAKGFGFLSQEDGEDVYVRSSALPAGVEGLKAGQRVEFGVASGPAAQPDPAPPGGPGRSQAQPR